MKNLFVINPVSGGNEKDSLPSLIEEFAHLKGVDYKTLRTTGEDDAERIEAEISAYQPDKIAVAGGDGTLQLIVKVLVGMKLNHIPVGIIPLGSANGLARSLNIPMTVEAALSLFFDSSSGQKVDVLRVNDKYICIHLGDVGTNALLVKSYEENEERGLMGYARYLISAIAESTAVRFTITADGIEHRIAGYMLVFTNASRYGTGVRVTQGLVTDGYFEIRVIRKIDLEEAVKAGLTIFNLFVDKKMYDDVIQCKTAEIVISSPSPMQLDGEFVGEHDRLKIQIMEGAIQLILPDDER